MRPDRVHQPFHIHDAQKGRRTAAPENRSDSALLIKLTLLHDLRDKGVDVGLRDVRIRSRSALLSAPGIPDNLSPRIHDAHVCVTRRADCQRCRHEGFLRHFHITHLTHPLLAFLLLFQKLFLTADIAAIAFCKHVLAHRLDGFPGDNLAADCRLNRNFEQMARDFIL